MTFRCAVGTDAFAVRALLQSLAAAPPLADLAPDRRSTAELVLAEVLNNVAEHAYGGRDGQLSVTVRLTAAGLSCRIVDSGLAMPATGLPPGHLPALAGTALGELPEGGFGWHLIRSLTTELSYARENGQNRLSFLIPV